MPVPINSAAPMGGMITKAVADILRAASDIERAQDSAALVIAGSGTLDAGDGLALFGGASGTHDDYAYALGNLNTQLGVFMAAAEGYLATLDNGNPE